ncbi:MAG: co-chaperone GroES [Candidatus Roizmanbacteria bacterium]|nr:co-chaperone GroES [Candidatus Roizmanbacteria bacterium]
MSKTPGNIKPLFDYVLIKPVESESKTASGIVLPDSVDKKSQVGEVMAVGPGSDCCGDKCCDDEKGKCAAMVVKVGQKVLYKKWGGNEVKVGNAEWLLLEQKDVMAIVE